MTFLERIFDRLSQSAAEPVVREVRDGMFAAATGGGLLGLVQQAREFLARSGLEKGSRCVLYGPNSIRWVAMDLAILAEGLIVVPLDPRQVAAEISAVLADSEPSLVFCADADMATHIPDREENAARTVLFSEVFTDAERAPTPAGTAQPFHHADHDASTIIYTSGTSGEPKGVVLNAGNITFMLGCTSSRLDLLMGGRREPDQVFQYAPFCFAAARILLWTSLARGAVLTLSTDLTKIAEELKLAQPDYFVNVPMFLERVRRRVEESLAGRGGLVASLYASARQEHLRRFQGGRSVAGSASLWLAGRVLFPAIRRSIGPNLKALICGSAPLAVETQLFYDMLGIRVLQVYGLTETTAICTMDDPRRPVPGRVGPAIPGVEMRTAENGEILVRGPNVFPGYWRRPAATAEALAGGWFHTGDQGEADTEGNWRITGRLKNLIVLNSGHNVAPEPIEHELAADLPDVRQVVLLGNQRSYLAALVVAAGANGNGPEEARTRIQSAIDAHNASAPHYKQIRAFHVLHELFTPENGLLTTLGKMKREAIAARYAAEIDAMYHKRPA